MSRWTAKPQRDATNTPSGPGDFHDYVARNLSSGYRLAVIVLDDPIEAAALVHNAIMSVWRPARPESGRDLDDACRHRLDADLQAAIRGAGPVPSAVAVEPLEAAIAGLSPRLQIDLARGFGPLESAASGGGGGTWPDADTTEALRTLRARLNAPDAPAFGPGDPETDLRALYRSRDPGETAPLQLRLRLQQDSRDVEVATAEQARTTRTLGWGFAVNAFLAVVVLTLVVALASVVDLRASTVVAGDPTADPPTPLVISSVSVLQGGIDGEAVHVGSTQRTLIVSFAASTQWHASAGQCLADIVGAIDWQGNTTWVGTQAGHADMIVGDPSSASAIVSGPGAFCQVGRFVSTDGGLTWSAGSLPGDATSSPTWLGFDPANPGTLLAFYPGIIQLSADAGITWTAHQSTVTPLAFDSTGRLVGWTPGYLFESLDDGLSWRETGPGPTDQPVSAGATANGILIGAHDGLWWYPVSAAPSHIKSGSVFSVATLGDSAVVLGADSAGHPWLGTVDTTNPGISLADLPPSIAALHVTGGGVAVNDSGGAVAFAGSSSILAVVQFAR
jgi:hypothetical protein